MCLIVPCTYTRRYGYHITVTSYFVNRDPVVTVRFFNNIRYGTADGGDDSELKVSCVCLRREYSLHAQYPTHIAGMRVVHVRDLTIGYDTEQPDKKPVRVKRVHRCIAMCRCYQ